MLVRRSEPSNSRDSFAPAALNAQRPVDTSNGTAHYIRGLLDPVNLIEVRLDPRMGHELRLAPGRNPANELQLKLDRSAATGTDRAQKYLFKATGGRLSEIFDGSEQLISITSLPFYSRQVFLPEPM